MLPVPDDGRILAAEADIDNLQQSVSDGFQSLHQRIGELSGTLTASHAAILQRLDAQMITSADLTRRIGVAETTLAAHDVRLGLVEGNAAQASQERVAKRAAAYGRRWQWVGWVIAIVASGADAVRAFPHLLGGGRAP